MVLVFTFALTSMLQSSLAHDSNYPPRVNTKEECHDGPHCTCGSTEDPGWFLKGCSVPLGKTKSGENIPNITGHWEGTDKDGKLHWERIEQCGDRVLVTTVGKGGYFLVHDFPHADDTEENGCKDFSGMKLPSCSAIKVNTPMLVLRTIKASACKHIFKSIIRLPH